jgi:hypothetical protein
MSLHLHRARRWAGWALVVAGLSPFGFCFGLREVRPGPTPITGQVTMAGRPLTDSTICIDSDGAHAAFAPLQADGRFELIPMNTHEGAELTGRFRAHLYNLKGNQKLPSKVADPKTSGIEMNVGSGWNEFRIDLP